MSPDPSVHEEQLAAIERNRQQDLAHARRRPGCFSRLMFLAVVVLLGIAGLILWNAHTRGTSASVEAGRLVHQASDEERRLSGKSPEEIAATLRQKIDDLKKNWTNHGPEVEDLNRRVEALRTTIAEKKRKASETLSTQYEDLRKRAEDLAQSAKAQGEKAVASTDKLQAKP